MSFKTIKLSDVAIITMGQSPQGEYCNTEGLGIPLLNGPTEFGEFYPTPVQYTTAPKKHAKPLDLLFCVRGSTTGRMNWADQQYAIGRGLATIHTKDSNLRYFVEGILNYRLNELLNMATGSTFPNVSKSMIENLEIPYLDYISCQKISKILESINQKIELNNRINKNLEKMAQAIFKQWFVNFEYPNEHGEPYKSSGGKMVLCEELGKEIPEGWGVGPVTELIDINPKRVLKKGTTAIYVEMKSVPSFEPRITNWIMREVGSGTKFINGDVLLARITPCLENGKTAFVDILPENEVGWGSTEFIVLRSKNQEALEYAYILARSDEFRDHAIKNMTGSSGRQRVPDSCFDNLLLAIPPNSMLTEYGAIITPFFKKMKQNGEINVRLSALRGTLLPKLMSGEIDVSNIEI